MKGLAVYTIVIFVIHIIGAISGFGSVTVWALAMLTPITIFAIIYLVKDRRKYFCGTCGAKQ
jgi:hypothetical protein